MQKRRNFNDMITLKNVPDCDCIILLKKHHLSVKGHRYCNKIDVLRTLHCGGFA